MIIGFDADDTLWHNEDGFQASHREFETLLSDYADPMAIEVGTTVERPLPTTDEESQELLEFLSHLREMEITHFTMDFGHPLTPEHVHRFAEQVINVMRAT